MSVFTWFYLCLTRDYCTYQSVTETERRCLLFITAFMFSYWAERLCAALLCCWHMNAIPAWREQKKGLAAGLKKKSRHAWQQQYKHTSYHTCSTSPVWCDKNHHIGWEAWQTVGRHAQTQHNPIDITCLGALCTTELRRGRTCTLQNGFNATNTNLTWHIIRSVLFPRKAAKKV